MKVKRIIERISDEPIRFCDITTGTGNYVLADSNCVIHNSHITSLLMVLFLKLVPGLIQDATKIYRVLMPLYGAMKAGKFYPFYDEESKEKFVIENPNIKLQRYKGLGEMNPDQLKVCLIDQDTRKLELIEYPTNFEEIFKLMSDAELKRDLLGNEN
jgi:DNA gyrase/topoisomerase IV subunit B